MSQEDANCTAELFGRIVKIIQRGIKGKDAIFVVNTQTLKRDFTCVCSFFAPIEEGDAIYAICTFESSNRYGTVLRLTRPPFVQISMDKDSVQRCFIRVLRGTGFGASKANALFDIFSKQAGSNAKVVAFISELAGIWNEAKDDDLFIPYESVVKKDQMRKLMIWWFKNRSLRRLYLFGLTNREIEACKMPHDKIYECLLTNPYKLVPLSIDKCDEILLRQNKVGTPEDRRCAQIIRKMYDNMNDKSWTGTPSRLLQSMFSDLMTYLERLRGEYGVIGDYHTVYLHHPHRVEQKVSENIDVLLKTGKITPETPMDSKLRESVDFLSKTLTDEQKLAVQGALDNNICIITGGAGTGKTTIIGEIVHNLDLRDERFAIASFTGKAVARIREVIKRRSPSTLHRMIARAYTLPKFTHLIIDEASMITTELFYEFTKAFSHSYRITLVGDPNQLQPIGWGTLFEQLLKSGRVPTFRLSQNQRLEKVGNDINGIMVNANGLIDVDPEQPFEFVTAGNFSLIEGSVDIVYDVLRALYNTGISANDITIITPYNKEIDELNKTAQQIFNENAKSVVDSRGKLWCVKDRVMLTENNYDINVMNAEEGIVTDVNPEEIAVQFKDGATHIFRLDPTEQDEEAGEGTSSKGSYGSKKPYNKKGREGGEEKEESVYAKELVVTQLAHAFCLSIHRAQGSEWKYVVIAIPSHSANSSFLNRNMIYTAITRAKTACWVVGDIEAFKAAAFRNPGYRCENLAERLNKVDLTVDVKSVDASAPLISQVEQLSM